MRFHTSTAAALVLAAGLTVSGCTPIGSTSASGGSATTTPVANTDSSTQAGGGASTATSSQNAQAAGTGGTCQAANLSFALGAKSGNSSQTTQAVDLTNRGSSSCTMDGFPGVDLVGAANGQQNYTWSLRRSSASYSQVTLQPGGTAHFDLVYLPSASGAGSDITVVKMVVTPPSGFTQAEVTWNQSVPLQDGATHPGTYITPIVPGS